MDITTLKESNHSVISKGTVVSKGAGSILFSSLVYNGYKLSNVLITESDEKYLFEIEVGMKLYNKNTLSNLRDLLVNFPPQAIISRVSLIYSLLEVIGSVFIGDKEESANYQLNPATAVSWFNELICKSIESFKVLYNGHMCSIIPQDDSYVIPSIEPLYSEEYTIYGNLSNMPKSSKLLVNQVYHMRYPNISLAKNRFEELDDKIKSENKAANVAGLPPLPSLPGLVFAVCAASLPLLQNKDLEYGQVVLKLFLSSCSKILEPRVIINNSGNTGSSYQLTEIDGRRLQHILNRIEQLLLFFEYKFNLNDYIDMDCNDIESISNYSFNMVLIRLVAHVLTVIPYHLFTLEIDTTYNKVCISKQTYELLYNLVIYTNEIKIFPDDIIDKLVRLCEYIHSENYTMLSNYVRICDDIIQFNDSNDYEIKTLIKYADKLTKFLLPKYDDMIYNVFKSNLSIVIPILYIYAISHPIDKESMKIIDKNFKLLLLHTDISYTHKSIDVIHLITLQEALITSLPNYEDINRFISNVPLNSLDIDKFYSYLSKDILFTCTFVNKYIIKSNQFNICSKSIEIFNEIVSHIGINSSSIANKHINYLYMLCKIIISEMNINSEKTTKYSNISNFINKFERFIYDLSNEYIDVSINNVRKWYCLGLFHKHKLTRHESVYHILNDSLNNLIDIYDNNNLEILPLNQSIILQRLSNTTSKIKTVNPAITHTDIQKISKIVINHEDYYIKSTAISQLITMFESNHNLLKTYDKILLYKFINQLIMKLHDIFYDVGGNINDKILNEIDTLLDNHIDIYNDNNIEFKVDYNINNQLNSKINKKNDAESNEKINSVPDSLKLAENITNLLLLVFLQCNEIVSDVIYLDITTTNTKSDSIYIWQLAKLLVTLSTIKYHREPYNVIMSNSLLILSVALLHSDQWKIELYPLELVDELLNYNDNSTVLNIFGLGSSTLFTIPISNHISDHVIIPNINNCSKLFAIQSISSTANDISIEILSNNISHTNLTEGLNQKRIELINIVLTIKMKYRNRYDSMYKKNLLLLYIFSDSSVTDKIITSLMNSNPTIKSLQSMICYQISVPDMSFQYLSKDIIKYLNNLSTSTIKSNSNRSILISVILKVIFEIMSSISSNEYSGDKIDEAVKSIYEILTNDYFVDIINNIKNQKSIKNDINSYYNINIFSKIIDIVNLPISLSIKHVIHMPIHLVKQLQKLFDSLLSNIFNDSIVSHIKAKLSNIFSNINSNIFKCLNNNNQFFWLNKNGLSDLIKQLKIIQLPDSFQYSCVYINQLILLNKVISYIIRNTSNPLNEIDNLIISSNFDWVYRLIYDRRNDIRLLGILIYNNLYKYFIKSDLMFDKLLITQCYEQIITDINDCLYIRLIAMSFMIRYNNQIDIDNCLYMLLDNLSIDNNLSTLSYNNLVNLLINLYDLITFHSHKIGENSVTNKLVVKIIQYLSINNVNIMKYNQLGRCLNLSNECANISIHEYDVCAPWIDALKSTNTNLIDMKIITYIYVNKVILTLVNQNADILNYLLIYSTIFIDISNLILDFSNVNLSNDEIYNSYILLTINTFVLLLQESNESNNNNNNLIFIQSNNLLSKLYFNVNYVLIHLDFSLSSSLEVISTVIKLLNVFISHNYIRKLITFVKKELIINCIDILVNTYIEYERLDDNIEKANLLSHISLTISTYSYHFSFLKDYVLRKYSNNSSQNICKHRLLLVSKYFSNIENCNTFSNNSLANITKSSANTSTNHSTDKTAKQNEAIANKWFLDLNILINLPNFIYITRRSKTRGYIINKPVVRNIVLSNNEGSSRLSLWTSLLLLNSIIISDNQGDESISHLCNDINFSTTINQLLQYLHIWGNEKLSNSRYNNCKPWYPNDFDLAGAITSFFTSFIYNNSYNKLYLYHSHHSYISYDKNANDLGMIHLLLTRSLAKDVMLPIRWVYVNIIISCINNIMNDTMKSSARQKQALFLIIIKTIEDILQYTRSQHEMSANQSQLSLLFLLIDALAGCAVNESNQSNCNKLDMTIDSLKSTNIKIKSISSLATPRNNIDSIDNDYTPSSLISLINRLSSLFRSKYHVLSALSRCIGRISYQYNHNYSNKYIFNVNNEDCIKFLLDIVLDKSVSTNSSDNCTSMRVTALVALWILLHNSEQAKAYAKKIIKNDFESVELNINISLDELSYDQDTVEKAKRALQDILLK